MFFDKEMLINENDNKKKLSCVAPLPLSPSSENALLKTFFH